MAVPLRFVPGWCVPRNIMFFIVTIIISADEDGAMYGLYVITDENLSNGLSHSEVARLACEGGADVIQLRDKYMDRRELLAAARDIRRITDSYNVMFIVNDHLDIAIASEADGVHLGQEDMGLAEAFMIAGNELLIGISVSSPEEAAKAEKGGADYIGFGPIFGTSSKLDAGPAVGLSALRDIRKVTEIPIVAIGGINEKNAPSVIEAGADGVAVISAVVSQSDIKKAAADLKAIIDAALKHRKAAGDLVYP